MNDLQNTLPELLRRATDDLTPDTPDLVERGLRRGVTLRRRRRALTGAGTAAAVLVAGGAVIGGHLVGPAADAGPQVSGPPAPKAAATSASKAVPSRPAGGTPEQAERTLRQLLPRGVRVVSIESSRTRLVDINSIDVTAVIDDGKGRTTVDLQLNRSPDARPGNQGHLCADRPERCRVLPDGSALSWSQPDEWQLRKGPDIARLAAMGRSDGTGLSIGNSNGTDAGTTRSRPILTVAQLQQMVRSKAWRFPAPIR